MTTSLLFMDRYSLGSVGYGSNAMEQGGGRPNGDRYRNRGWQPQGEMRKNGVTASLGRRAAQHRDGGEGRQMERADIAGRRRHQSRQGSNGHHHHRQRRARVQAEAEQHEIEQPGFAHPYQHRYADHRQQYAPPAHGLEAVKQSTHYHEQAMPPSVTVGGIGKTLEQPRQSAAENESCDHGHRAGDSEKNSSVCDHGGQVRSLCCHDPDQQTAQQRQEIDQSFYDQTAGGCRSTDAERGRKHQRPDDIAYPQRQDIVQGDGAEKRRRTTPPLRGSARGLQQNRPAKNPERVTNAQGRDAEGQIRPLEFLEGPQDFIGVDLARDHDQAQQSSRSANQVSRATAPGLGHAHACRLQTHQGALPWTHSLSSSRLSRSVSHG